MNDEYTESVTQRLQLATGDTSYRQIGVLTGTHPETVRRYMNGQSPSAAFLSSISNNFGISGEWLLTGRGPMLTKDILAHILQSSSITYFKFHCALIRSHTASKPSNE